MSKKKVLLMNNVVKNDNLIAFLKYDYAVISGYVSKSRNSLKMCTIMVCCTAFFHMVFMAISCITPSSIWLGFFYAIWGLLSTGITVILVICTKRAINSDNSYSLFNAETLMYITTIAGLDSIVVSLVVMFYPTNKGVIIALFAIAVKWVLTIPILIILINNEIESGKYLNGSQEKRDIKDCNYRYAIAAVGMLKDIVGPAVLWVCMLVMIGTYMRPLVLQLVKWNYANKLDLTYMFENSNYSSWREHSSRVGRHISVQ